MIPAHDPRAPKYWMHETSGKLAAVVKKYLAGDGLNAAEFGLMAAYLRQWIDSPAWEENPHGGAGELRGLRQSVRDLRTPADLERWLARAVELGIDPL